MKDLAPALFTALAADNDLTALLASEESIYHEEAPQGAEFPYVIFNLQGGTDNYTLKARSWVNRVVQVKGLAISPQDAPDATVADDVADAIDVVLTDGPLTISGATLLTMRRISPVHYSENTPAGMVTHAGGLYRIGTADA